jgi:hypothetical protein
VESALPLQTVTISEEEYEDFGFTAEAGSQVAATHLLFEQQTAVGQTLHVWQMATIIKTERVLARNLSRVGKAPANLTSVRHASTLITVTSAVAFFAGIPVLEPRNCLSLLPRMLETKDSLVMRW